METLKIVGLCLSSFSLGISLTGLFFTMLNYREAGRKLKRMDEADRKLKQMERELEEAKKKEQEKRNDKN